MNIITISPKYQVVIPKEIRQGLALAPGTKMQMFQFGERIEMVPVRDIKSMRGFLKGIDTTIERDDDRL